MDIKIKTDLRVVLSLSEDEVLKLLTFIDYARVMTDISKVRSYENQELEDFVYSLGKDINLSLEDKLVN